MLVHLADVSLNPSVNALPGGGTLQDLTNGLGAWALIAALAGLLIGAAAWALGVHSQNFQQSLVGRRAVLVSGLAARSRPDCGGQSAVHGRLRPGNRKPPLVFHGIPAR